MTDFEISPAQRDLEALAKEFARRRLAPQARSAERALGPPEGLGEAFSSLELALVAVPESLGGMGEPLLTAALVEQALAEGDLGLVLALGAPADAPVAVAAAVPDAAAARRLMAPCALCLAADVRLGPGPRLDGRVTGVPGAGRHGILTWARGEGRGWLVRVEPDAPGRRVRPLRAAMGLRAAELSDVELEEAAIDPEAAWPVTAAQLARAAAVQRLLGAARLVGVGRAALAEAVAYASRRRAFGEVIARHQGVGFLLADMWVALEEAWALVWLACAGGWDDEGFVRRAEDAWALARRAAGAVTSDAVGVLGGAGYMADAPVEKFFRDAHTYGSLVGAWDPGVLAAQAPPWTP